MDIGPYFMQGVAAPENRTFLHDVLDLGLRFIAGETRDGRVVQYRDLGQLRELVRGSIPQAGCELSDLLRDLEMIAANSVAQGDPRFLAFPDTGNSLATIAAEIFKACTNQNLITVDRGSPVATFIEIQLISWMRELIGYSSLPVEETPSLRAIGGMWTSGGNMSNHVAVLAALAHRFPEVREEGLVALDRRPVMVLAKGVEHFSFLGAAQALGLGRQGIVWADAASNYLTDVESVRSTLERLPSEVEPFMVVAVAGNCRTTSIDDIDSLRAVCDEHGIWLHVDACHGGSLLFSRKLRHHLRGIESSDSVSLDPHKGMYVSYASSYVLFRDPASLARFARYPDKLDDPSCFDLGLITPFYGSRGFDSLKLWMLIRHLGVDGFERVVESREQVYRHLVDLLDDMKLFVFLHEPIFYRSAFVFCPPKIREQLLVGIQGAREERIKQLQQLVSRHTTRFCESLYQSGEVVFDLFTLPDLDNRIGLGTTSKYDVMALAVGHPFLEADTIREISSAVRLLGASCADEMSRDLEAIMVADGYPVEDGANISDSPASW